MSKSHFGIKLGKRSPEFVKLNKAVLQYDLNGNFIKEFISAKEAKLETGASKISEVCNNKRKTSGGYDWKFK